MIASNQSGTLEETKDEIRYSNIVSHFKPKQFTDHQKDKLSRLTNYVEVTILELLTKVKKE